MRERAYSEFYSEQENSLRRFRINEMMKRSKNVEVKHDTIERTQPVIDPSANVGDVQLARRFSEK
jgi:hypothetical protein